MSLSAAAGERRRRLLPHREERAPPAGPRNATRLLNRSTGRNLLYVLPGLALYAVFIFLPILASALLSLSSWNGITRPAFVGIENYAKLALDPRFWIALRNNATFILFYSALPIAIGLLLSAAIGAAGRRERLILRVLVFLPYVMPMALIGIVWQWLYNPAFGPIAQVLRTLGLGRFVVPFLGSFTAALPAVGFVATWYFSGFCMALLLSGMQRLDPHLQEAAELDGASRAQTFRHVTMPALLPEIRIALLLTVIASIKVFDLVFVMTRGGPGTTTLVTNIYMYDYAFQQGAFGYGAAVSLVGTVLVLLMNYAIHLAFARRG